MAGAILYKDKVYGVGGSIIEGYYKVADGKFYEEDTYTTEIPGAKDLLYIDLSTKMQFLWNGSSYDNITENAKPTVTEAGTRTNIASGDTLKTIIGKIKKFFSDLKDLAFKAIDGANSKKYLRGDGTWQSALELQGRVYDSGDDEGLVIKPASNNWAGISLVNNTGRHTYFAMKNGQSDVPLWRFHDGTNMHDIIHPAKSGIIAVTSDITDEKVTGQLQNPSSGTWYYVPFIGTTNQKPYYNNGLRCVAKEGTTSADGEGSIILGNSTASGTAGNKKGYVGLYANNSRLAYLHFGDSATADRAFALPDKSGTIALTSDLPAAVAVKGDKESTYRTGNVNLTPANIGAVYYAGNLNTTLPSDTPAAETIAYWESNVPVGSVVLGYNSAGEEFTLIFSKGANNQYGSIIKYGYGSKYIRILRKQANQWKSNDWEVMDAGYADTAGSAPASDVYAWAKEANKPTYAYDEIEAGYIKVGDGTNYQLFRFDNGWRAGMYYHTNGDEAMVFGNKNTRASWIFANTDPEARTAWTNLSPAMHIKNGKVAIGKLIPNSSYLTYELEVNGDVQATNFRGSLIGNADTATKATQDGDGNTISSTYLKLSGGTMTGNIYTPADNGKGILPVSDGKGTVGTSSRKFKFGHIEQLYSSLIDLDGSLEISENGDIQIAYNSSYYVGLITNTLTATRTQYFPNASGTISVSGSSSRKTKKNIENMTDAEAKKLLDLRPVKFDYITEEDGTNCYGLIAEEVQDAGIEYPVFTHHDKRLDEDVPALEYSKFVPYLIKMVQMQQQEIDLLKQEVADLNRI